MRAWLFGSVVLAGALVVLGGTPAGTGLATGTAPAGPRVVEAKIGKIALPAGWEIDERQGRDSWPGIIAKAGGLGIMYDMYRNAGDGVGDPKEYSWYREQVIAGQTVRLGLRPESPGKPGGGMALQVSWGGIPGGMGATVTKPSEVAEALGVALTLETKGERKGVAKNVATLSGKVFAPGKLALPEGWTHTKEQGIDTVVGRLTREGGLTVRYAMGFMVGLDVDPVKNKYPWHMEQVVRGRAVNMALTNFEGQDTLAISFVDGPANFRAQVKTLEDVAEVMGLVMSFEYEVAGKAGEKGP